MTMVVGAKGQVTIPKALRKRFGIEPGAQVQVSAVEGGIHLTKVRKHPKRQSVFGCLKKELSGRDVKELVDDLRGPVEQSPGRPNRHRR